MAKYKVVFLGPEDDKLEYEQAEMADLDVEFVKANTASTSALLAIAGEFVSWSNTTVITSPFPIPSWLPPSPSRLHAVPCTRGRYASPAAPTPHRSRPRPRRDCSTAAGAGASRLASSAYENPPRHRRDAR